MLVALSGCNLLGHDAAMVGTWESSLLGVTTTYVLNGDGSVLGTVSVLEIGVSTAGIWNADSTVLSIAWEGSAEAVANYYSFNSDKSQMTLSPIDGGLARTFSRK
jgi:hypothetical protein